MFLHGLPFSHTPLHNSLSALWMSLLGRGSLEQSNLGFSSPSQAGQYLQGASSLIPLWQLLGRDGIGALSPVQPLHQLRALGVSAANIERPRNQGAKLIVIQLHAVIDHASDTFRESLDVLLQ